MFDSPLLLNLFYVLLTFLVIWGLHTRIKHYIKSKLIHAQYPKYQSVPEVAGKLPIAGHGIEFGKDIIGFIKRAYKEHGKIFKIKVFRNEIIVVCDRTLITEYFSAKEEEMSLYSVLNALYFGDAFSDDPSSLSRIIKLVRKTIALRYDLFAPKIMSEARSMIQRMRAKAGGNPVELTTEAIRFVSNTSARCFISMELSQEFFTELMKFTNFLNVIVKLTYFFPKGLLKFVFDPFLRRYRHKIRSFLYPEIEKYRQDPTKNDSLVFRHCVDSEDALTNDQISDVVLCLLYVSSENTALGLSACVTDLGCNRNFWNKVKEEVATILEADDHKSLFSAPLLDACVYESARLNSHVFALQRRPMKKQTLGNYFVGNADSIAICEPVLMSLESADDAFADPLTYNPDRFVTGINGRPKEPKTSSQLLTWGSGVHQCPGAVFSVYEIKAALALIATNFEYFDLTEEKIGKRDMFSPSAFAERHVKVDLKVISETGVTVNYNGRNYEIENINNKGWLIRNYLSTDEQISYYNYTTSLSAGCKEQKEIITAPKDMSYCLAFYNLVYTGTSNCQEPTKWLNLAQDVWKMLESNSNKLTFPKIDAGEFNSVYCQLFGNEGQMAIHQDEFVSYGVSVSIGASCEFSFDGKTIRLNSGDIIVADFSKVWHGVLGIDEKTLPEWFNDDRVSTFNRSRLSVQIRHAPARPAADYMSEMSFKDLITKKNN